MCHAVEYFYFLTPLSAGTFMNLSSKVLSAGSALSAIGLCHVNQDFLEPVCCISSELRLYNFTTSVLFVHSILDIMHCC